MKRLSIFLALALLLTYMVTPALAAGWQENFETLGEEGLPQGWTATSRGNCTVTTEENGIGLRAGTDESTSMSILLVNSPAMALEGGRYLIQVQMGIDEASTFSDQDYFDLALGSTRNSLIRWKAQDGAVAAFALNGQQGTPVALGESARYLIAVDPQGNTASIWMDDVQLYGGALPDGYGSIDLSLSQLIFCNTARGGTKTNTMYLESVSVENAAAAQMTSTPANGAEMVPVESIQEISVDFGVAMEPDTFAQENITLLMDGENVNFSLSSSESTLQVAPTNGFQAQKTYELHIGQAADIFGVELGEQIISFTTAAAGYTAPQVSLRSPVADAQFYEGESVPLEAQVEAEQAIVSVEFYCNGQLAAQTSSQPYTASLSGLTEGTYTIYARVNDAAGGYGESATVTVTVQHNAPPVITVPLFDISDVPQVERAELTQVSILAEDEDDSVAGVTVYWNAENIAQFTQEPYTIDLSQCQLGRGTLRIEATDSRGAVGEYEKEIILINQTREVLFESDFSSYTAPGNSGLVESGVADKQGYTEPGIIDQEHGTSMFLGSTVASNVQDIGPNVVLMLSNATATYEVETDLYFPTEHTNFMLRFRNTANGTELKILEFTSNNEIRLLGSGGMEENTALRTFQRNTWYHLRTVVNAAAKTYDFYLDDELLVRGRLGENAEQISGVSQLRWSMYNYSIGEDQVEDGYIALDNVKVTQLTSLPYITGVSSDLSSDEAVYDAATFYAKLSAAIANQNLGSLVTLSCDLGQIPLASVSYDAQNMAVVMTPQFPLSPGMEYTVTISKNTALDGGGTLGEDISFTFTTTGGDLSLSGGFRSQGNQVFFEGEVSNQAGEEKTVLLILNLWQDGALQQAFVTRQSVAQEKQRPLPARV